MRHKWLTAVLCVCVILLIISGSIALPIYFRPFYYWQMDALQVVERTGYDAAALTEAYDEVLDYLTIPGQPFGTGTLPYSAEGESHFADCRVLFLLNTGVLLFSLSGLIILWIMRRKGCFHLHHLRGKHPATWCGAGLLTLFGLIGGLVALDFDAAFVVFHQLFFPGKTNWILNTRTDPFVDALPPAFFLNCGVLILVCIVLSCVALLIYGYRHQKRV